MKHDTFIQVFRGKVLLLILIIISMQGINAEVRLPRLISNGMVLQRDVSLHLWGWASPKESVAITFQGKSFQTKADKTGAWKLTLPAYSAGGPYSMKINTIELTDIYVGDVWISSGQSNMELPLRRTLDLYKDEVMTADNPNIKLFRVPMKYNFNQEETDLQGGEWLAVTPGNILNFSAISYFFAKDIYDKYQIPIGIISTAIGGSPAEAWVSKDYLQEFPSYLSAIDLMVDKNYTDSVRQTESELSKQWHNLLDKQDIGVSVWNKDNVNVADWKSVSLPGYWSDKKIGVKSGSIWLRKEFEISESMTGKPATLRLGCIVDSDSAFVNGVFVGATSYQYPPRIYTIPSGILRKGTNNVTVRTVSNGGRGGFVEEKPYKIIIGKDEIDLTGDWKFRIGTEMKPSPSQTFFQYKPTGLFNGMIAPISNYNIKGVIWYQGESNTGNPKEYKNLFVSLIHNWRNKWDNQQLPFIYAQLPNFMKVVKEPVESNWAELREAQKQSLSVSNTAMAVTIDLGEWNDIHPLNKKEVARRLFLEADRLVYKDSTVVSSAPQYESMEIIDNSIVLSFRSNGKGFYTNVDIKGFAIAGADKKYVWAKASFLPGNKIRVWSNQIQNPISVRYAWSDNPADANLKSIDGLPTSPFTTQSY